MEQASWRRHLEEGSWGRDLGGGILEEGSGSHLGGIWRHLGGIWEASGGIWEASGKHLEARRLREAPTGSGEEKITFSIVKTMIFVKSLKNRSIS